jgi:uncharacterized membrane-anchored protein
MSDGELRVLIWLGSAVLFLGLLALVVWVMLAAATPNYGG